jgi:hypothetical protein
LSDRWYYADYNGQNGPVTLQELKATLSRAAEPENVLVWHDGFPDWMKAGAVAELKAQISKPPRLPTDQIPTWQVKWWWWYPVPFISIGIGSQVGRKVVIWSSAQRRKARLQKRLRDA